MEITYLHGISDSPNTLAEVPALALGLPQEGIGAAVLLAGLQLNKALKAPAVQAEVNYALSNTFGFGRHNAIVLIKKV